jgi:hypothetical protein
MIEIKTTKIKTKLTDKVLEEIKYLNNNIYDEEWSGILFYKMIGCIEDIDNLEILLVDILPMDKGSTASTNFEYDERFLEYLDSNPELEDCKHGLIHSHNTMSTFYSQTDISELEDNTKFHNFYLSVVSNNKLELIGKLCFLGKPQIEDVKYSVKNEKGKIFNMIFKKKEEPKEEIISFDCDIEIPKNSILSDSFIEKVKSICRPKIVHSYYGNTNRDFCNDWNDYEDWGNYPSLKNQKKKKKQNNKNINNKPLFSKQDNNIKLEKDFTYNKFEQKDAETIIFNLLSGFFFSENFNNNEEIYNYIVSNIHNLCDNNMLDRLEAYIKDNFRHFYVEFFNYDTLRDEKSFEEFKDIIYKYIDSVVDTFYEDVYFNASKDKISYFFSTIEDVILEVDYE